MKGRRKGAAGRNKNRPLPVFTPFSCGCYGRPLILMEGMSPRLLTFFHNSSQQSENTNSTLHRHITDANTLSLSLSPQHVVAALKDCHSFSSDEQDGYLTNFQRQKLSYKTHWNCWGNDNIVQLVSERDEAYFVSIHQKKVMKWYAVQR